MDYKLLALDMDGTLLNSQKKISPSNVAAINKVIERGVNVVFASGRNLPEMNETHRVLGKIRYGILISGGMLFDFAEDKVIAVHPVPFDAILEIIDCGLDERAMIHLHTVRNSIARQQDVDHMADFGMGIYQSMFDSICVKADDLKQYTLEHKDEIIKVNLYHRSAESRQRSVERLKHLELEQVFAEGSALESSPRGISKASGLMELCRHLNIPIEQSIAMGDAPNDREILQTAGVGIAMGNASDDIKAIADFVTLDNDHDGVAHAIEKFFLRE